MINKLYIFLLLSLFSIKVTYGAAHADETSAKVNSCIENMRMILAEHPNMFPKGEKDYGNEPDAYGPCTRQTALCEALAEHNYYVVAHLLACNPVPDAFLVSDKSRTKSTALHLAVDCVVYAYASKEDAKTAEVKFKLLYEVIHALLLLGFNPQAATTATQATPFGCLLEHMSNRHLLQNKTVEAIFMLFLEAGIDLNFQNQMSRLPLGAFVTMIGPMQQNPRIYHYLKLLMRYKADPTVTYEASGGSCSLLDLVRLRRELNLKHGNSLAASMHQEVLDILTKKIT